jgi:hypothetical protein
MARNRMIVAVPSPVDAYLGEVAAHLRGPRQSRSRILTELHDGLEQAVYDRVVGGMPQSAAEHEAVAEFGTPHLVAAAWAGDLVAHLTDDLDGLAGRIRQFPVLVTLAGEDRAGVATAHGHDDVAAPGGLMVEFLGLLGRDVDPDLGHGAHRDRVDLLGWFRAGGPDLDGVAGEVAQPSGSHLGTTGIVDTDKQDTGEVGSWLVGHDCLPRSVR